MKGWAFLHVLFVRVYVYPIIKAASGANVDSTKQAEKIEQLEKDHGWREEEFDYILQFMRTILLKRMSPLLLYPYTSYC